jgi:ribose transport system permease protein
VTVVSASASPVRRAAFIERVRGVRPISRLRTASDTSQKIAINVLVLLLLWIVLSIVVPGFGTSDNALNVLRLASPVIVTATFFTLLLVAGGIDLSVGAVLAVGGTLGAWLSSSGWSPTAALFGAGLAGCAIGAVNGALVGWLRINTVIATLGIFYVIRGSLDVVTHQNSSYAASSFGELYSGDLGPIPIPAIMVLVALLVALVLERRTTLGRLAVLAGTNEEAAFLAGLPTRRTKVVLFTLVGGAAAVSGVIVAAQLGAGSPSTGFGFEFDVIVAAVVGGASLLGGEGSALGALSGGLIVASVNSAMNIQGISSAWQKLALGALLVLAVGLDVQLRRLSARASTSQNEKSADAIGPTHGAPSLMPLGAAARSDGDDGAA